jgi:hypothetical protein
MIHRETSQREKQIRPFLWQEKEREKAGWQSSVSTVSEDTERSVVTLEGVPNET